MNAKSRRLKPLAQRAVKVQRRGHAHVGAHALSHEAAFEHWVTMKRYEHAFDRLRMATKNEKDWVIHYSTHLITSTFTGGLPVWMREAVAEK